METWLVDWDALAERITAQLAERPSKHLFQSRCNHLLRARYSNDDPATRSEIAAIWGVSQERVKQVESKMMRIIRASAAIKEEFHIADDRSPLGTAVYRRLYPKGWRAPSPMSDRG